MWVHTKAIVLVRIPGAVVPGIPMRIPRRAHGHLPDKCIKQGLVVQTHELAYFGRSSAAWAISSVIDFCCLGIFGILTFTLGFIKNVFFFLFRLFLRKAACTLLFYIVNKYILYWLIYFYKPVKLGKKFLTLKEKECSAILMQLPLTLAIASERRDII